MKREKENKKKKTIYDIVPPHLLENVILTEKKVSKMAKMIYLFLRTSKYSSVFLVLGVAILGGAIILGFSPKTEKMELFPTQYKQEGGWQNVEMAIERNFSNEAAVSAFNHSNSASVLKPKEKVYGKFLNDDISSSEEEKETEETEETEESEEVEEAEEVEEDSAQSTEPAEEDKVETETETETEEEQDLEENLELEEEVVEEVEIEENKVEENSEEETEDLGFFKKTRNIFFIPKARAEEIDEDIEVEEIQEEEKFEDYEGTIIVPDVDGNLLFETEEEKEEKETQTIFTKELNAVYSDFSVSEKSGELKKIRIGFSFASFGEQDEDDEAIISWSLDNQNWNVASEFVLNKEYSNKNNSGYFYADVDEVINWEDIENIKIRFSYLTNNSEENYAPFFLDAVWLETESEKIDDDDEEINGEEKIKILSHKKDFKISEELEFKFKYKKEKENFLTAMGEVLGVVDYWDGINLSAEIISPNKEVFEISSEAFTLDEDGEVFVKLEKDSKFKPGLYKIILKIEEDGKTQIFEQDFTWGVLVINVNRSIYSPGEEAYLQMGVLKDDGHTVCDARLELRIMNYELGIEAILSTEDETIQYSGECRGDNVTDVPDYFAYWTTGEAGTYEMTLTNLDNGYEITDSFEVRDSVPFDIERIGPSRIYPPADYGMVLKIKVNQDFKGFVQEKVPFSFGIKNQELRIKNCETGEFEVYGGQFIMQDEDDIKLLRWHDLDLKQNDELEINYGFDAPNVSPDLHLLGPLGFYK